MLLDKKSGYAEVDVIEQAQDYLSRMADEGEPLPKVCIFKDYYNLDLSTVSEGVYFVKLIYMDGQTATMKMVKSN